MQAAMANAISSHSVELDDIDVLALFHFSPPVYSAALATAEQKLKDGRALVAALAAGCEMMERLSKAAQHSLRYSTYHTKPAQSDMHRVGTQWDMTVSHRGVLANLK